MKVELGSRTVRFDHHRNGHVRGTVITFNKRPRLTKSHIGTVWPHDTALIAEGMRRCGLRDEASRLAVALLEAAERFEHQLPEVFAGFARDAADVPVAYPGALRPQAWAAGAPLMALRTLLGLDVVDGRLEADPHSAEGVPRIELRRLRFRGRTVDVTG
jgi:glycogen debranching enzyme